MTQGVPSFAAEVVPDGAAGAAVVYPELPDMFVAACQGKAVVGQLMRKKRRVEVQAVVVGFGPLEPARKMLRLYLVARYLFIGLQINRMKVESVRTGDEAVSFVQILP